MADEKCIMHPNRDCLGLAKAEALERQLAGYREQARSTHEKLYDRIRELEKSEVRRGEQYEAIIEKLNKLLAWQEEQKSIPRNRWNGIVDKAIWAVLAAFIAYVLAQVGL